jgi:arginyl-tRNA synthetase
MDKFKEHILKALKKHVKDEIELEVPPIPELGDYAFPCFSLAKQHKKNPSEIAQDLAKKLKEDRLIDEIKVTGPYLNFFINKRTLTAETLKKILKEKDNYGSSNLGKNKKIILEHTSINPNASPHVGRARNALIGDSLARVLKLVKYDVEVHYLVNDIGKQIAMLVLGARKKKNFTFEDLLGIYQDMSKQVDNSKEREMEVLETLSRLEKGDKKIKGEFEKVVKIAVEGQVNILSELDIKYDEFDYESKYLWGKKTEDALELLKKTGKFYFDKDNRVVLDEKGFELGMKVPVLVLTRGDGTSLYSLRDIAYALDMQQKGENIVVMGEDHKLYSQQINAALLLLEKRQRKTVYYSFVLLEDGKMSTRKGNLVLLSEFMEQAIKKARDELKSRYGKVDDKTAKTIAYGALKYSILKVSPEKNVTFSWEQALSFEGETAPYIQYAYARICSIIRKYKKTLPRKADFSLLSEKEEIELIKKIALFPAIVEKTANELKPNIVSNYAYELAKQFNEFYHMHNILKEESAIKDARMLLAFSVGQVLKTSLSLLGIHVLEKM